MIRPWAFHVTCTRTSTVHMTCTRHACPTCGLSLRPVTRRGRIRIQASRSPSGQGRRPLSARRAMSTGSVTLVASPTTRTLHARRASRIISSTSNATRPSRPTSSESGGHLALAAQFRGPRRQIGQAAGTRAVRGHPDAVVRDGDADKHPGPIDGDAAQDDQVDRLELFHIDGGKACAVNWRPLAPKLPTMPRHFEATRGKSRLHPSKGLRTTANSVAADGVDAHLRGLHASGESWSGTPPPLRTPHNSAPGNTPRATATWRNLAIGAPRLAASPTSRRCLKQCRCSMLTDRRTVTARLR